MFTNVKCGKKPARHDKRTLALANYVNASVLPTPPDTLDYTTKITNLSVMLNNSLGDCTAAGCGHIRQAWTANNGVQQVWTDPQIQQIYSWTGGYDPNNPAGTDNGAVEIDVLNYWRKTGFFGDQIAGFMALEPQNNLHVKQSIMLFGGVYIGVGLPLSAQKQAVWHVTPGGADGDSTPGSWGGHCMVICSYNATGPIFITWGEYQQATWGWYNAYCDEAYALLSSDWATTNKVAPSGFNFTNLQADLALVTK